MHGWRGRIGLLAPSPLMTLEPEFYKIIPEGISVHATRLMHTSSTYEGLASLSDNIERGAEELATAKVDVIAFACTSGGVIKGEEYEIELKERITRASGGIPAVTVIGSVVDALKTFNINKLVISTPYVHDVFNREKDFMEKKGFQVLDIRGLGIEESELISREPSSTSYRMSKEMFYEYPEAEGIFISCTNYRSIEIIDKLEKDTGVPVVSSVQATLWNCLKKVKCFEPIIGHGKLLESMRAGLE